MFQCSCPDSVLESESNFYQHISPEALDTNCNQCISLEYVPIGHNRTKTLINNQSIAAMSHSNSSGSVFEQSGLSDSEHEHSLSFNLASKGINIWSFKYTRHLW